MVIITINKFDVHTELYLTMGQHDREREKKKKIIIIIIPAGSQ